jgi:hypothetical protein
MAGPTAIELAALSDPRRCCDVPLQDLKFRCRWCGSRRSDPVVGKDAARSSSAADVRGARSTGYRACSASRRPKRARNRLPVPSASCLVIGGAVAGHIPRIVGPPTVG